MADSPVSQSPVSQTLGRLPSGVFILTVRHEGQETGMLSSWVMQAGFEPPTVSVAVRHGRYVAEWLLAGAEFVLNLLPERDKSMLRHFARGFEPGEAAFEGLEIERSGKGVPILKGTVGHLECTPQQHIDSGDHHVFLANITGGAFSEGHRPMVHIRHSGMRY